LRDLLVAVTRIERVTRGL